MSASTGNKENAFNGQHKHSVQREMLPVSATMRTIVKVTQASSPAPEPQTQNDGKSSLTVKSVRGRSRHPPECQHCKTQPGCKSGEKCVFKQEEVDSQPSRKLKKTGGTLIRYLIEEFQGVRLRIPECGAAEIQDDFSEGAKRTCLMFAMIPRRVTSALQWSRPETNVSTQFTCRNTVSFATAVCWMEVLFQSSFSGCLTQNTLPAGHETSNPLVALWSGEGARCASRTQTERALSKDSFDPSSMSTVCIKMCQGQHFACASSMY